MCSAEIIPRSGLARASIWLPTPHTTRWRSSHHLRVHELLWGICQATIPGMRNENVQMIANSSRRVILKGHKSICFLTLLVSGRRTTPLCKKVVVTDHVSIRREFDELISNDTFLSSMEQKRGVKSDAHLASSPSLTRPTGFDDCAR
jgi:hypothetical protein